MKNKTFLLKLKKIWHKWSIIPIIMVIILLSQISSSGMWGFIVFIIAIFAYKIYKRWGFFKMLSGMLESKIWGRPLNTFEKGHLPKVKFITNPKKLKQLREEQYKDETDTSNKTGSKD